MIGKTIKVKGTISGNENLVIEGTVDGSVDLPQNDLTVGESGQVVANLDAKTVKVDGQVTGDISGSEKVVISKSGRVQGNIVAPRVTLEDGAKFKGSIDMDPGNDTVATEPKPAASAKSAAPSTTRDKAVGESGS
ncbi:MAG: polymer-forming cytoskeletal protein [Pseudomonadaceae bacterium]|nr:polymer-forming cytoskeletal protein [Pseudomonadaceae bacterium]